MLVIAHRGASGHAPENTLAAFRRALAMGAKAIEFDVHQTHDQELIVAHDDNLRRCAGDPRRLKDLRWAQDGARIDVGSWFDERFKGETMPTLSELFDLVPASVEMHLEIKHGSKIYPGIEERVLRFLRQRGALTRTLISSFDHAALFQVRSLDEKARLGYLLGVTSLNAAFRDMKKMSAESLNLGVRQARERTMKKAHDGGYRVFVYTVNTPADRDRLGRLGVDGIFSNYPELDIWR